MPLPIVGGFLGWLVGLFASVVGTLFAWLSAHFVYKTSIKILAVTAFVVASAGFFVTVSLALKVAVLALQIAMPNSLGLATYFLPSNINLIFSTIVLVRVHLVLYTWLKTQMILYVRTVY